MLWSHFIKKGHGARVLLGPHCYQSCRYPDRELEADVAFAPLIETLDELGAANARLQRYLLPFPKTLKQHQTSVVQNAYREVLTMLHQRMPLVREALRYLKYLVKPSTTPLDSSTLHQIEMSLQLLKTSERAITANLLPSTAESALFTLYDELHKFPGPLGFFWSWDIGDGHSQEVYQIMVAVTDLCRLFNKLIRQFEELAPLLVSYRDHSVTWSPLLDSIAGSDIRLLIFKVMEEMRLGNLNWTAELYGQPFPTQGSIEPFIVRPA